MQTIYSFKNIFREVRQSLRLSLPLVVSQIIFSLSGFIATMMVAHLGKEYLAANALVWSVFIALILFFIGIFNAITVMIAHSHGAKDITSARAITLQGLVLAIVFTIPMILSVFLAPKILLSGQNAKVIALATPYFHSLAWSILPLNLVVVLEQFLMGIGITRLVLIVSVFEVPLEIFLFYAFIFGKFGMPQFGMAGIGYGYALVLTIVFVAILLYVIWAKKCREYAIFSHGIKIDAKIIGEILRIGLPIGLMISTEVALFATMAYMMGKFGADVLAAHQIAYQYYVFSLAVIFGLSTGAGIRIGHAIGKDDKNALKIAAYVNLWLSFVWMLLIALFYDLGKQFMIGLDVNINLPKNQMIVRYATIFLSISSILFVIDSVRLMVTSILRSMKDTRYSLVISLITFWLIAFPLMRFLALKMQLSGAGIWWGMVIGLFIGAALLLVRFSKLIAKIDLKQLITRTE